MVFAAMVDAVDPGHFCAADAPLLVEYARAVDLCNQAAAEIEKSGAVHPDGALNRWVTVQEKAVRAIVALSARLRLSPQARFDRLVAGKNARDQHLGPRPWEDPDELIAGSGDLRSVTDYLKNGRKATKPKTGLASFR